MAAKTISAGSAPILWSTVNEAFNKINSNFQELYATLESNDITALDFTNLNTDLVPTINDTYNLGSSSKRWKTLFVNEGLSIGGALITREGLTIDLPSGSTVGGFLIKNPQDQFFNEVLVNGVNSITADLLHHSFNIEGGTGITATVNSATRSVRIANTGVISLSGSSAIGVSGGSGVFSIVNNGVTSLVSGQGVDLDASTGDVTIENTGVLNLSAGVGITLSNGGAPNGSGTVIVTNSAPAGNTFRTINITNSVNAVTSTAQAGSSADTLTMKQGSGISMVTDGSKQITFTNSGVTSLVAGNNITLSGSTGAVTVSFNNRVDINGSVFADDSSILVDATNGVLRGELFGNVTGDIIGNVTGNVIGNTTGYHTGDVKGSVFGDNSSLIVDGLSGTVYATVYGNITGYHYGDMTGSVFGDNSSKLVDGVEGKIVAPVEASHVITSSYLQVAKYASALAISTAFPSPTVGMIVFQEDTQKFVGWTGVAWAAFN